MLYTHACTHTYTCTQTHTYTGTHTHTQAHLKAFTTDTCTQYAQTTHTHTPCIIIFSPLISLVIVRRYCCLTCVIIMYIIYVCNHNLSVHRTLNNDFKYDEILVRKKLLDSMFTLLGLPDVIRSKL